MWFPPPDAALAAVEFMANAIHLEAAALHVIVIPCLMTCMWQRKVWKATDLFLTILLGAKVWKDSQLDPLTLFVYFSLSLDLPWRNRSRQDLQSLINKLSGMWSDSYQKIGNLLRQYISLLWSRARMYWGLLR